MDEVVNWELLAKYLAGECTPAEQKRVVAWLEADVRNQQYFQQLQQIWQYPPEDQAEVLPNSAALWQKLQFSMRQDGSVPVVPAKRPVHQVLPLWVWRIAAMVVFTLGLGWATYSVWETASLVVQQTQGQEQRLVTLPDGTKVWMNERSRLSYPRTFGEDARKVTLEGEAFFEVVHLERNQPFVIAAGKTETTVLGTSFNVDAFPDRGVEVTVVTGKVALVNSEKPAQRVVLTKGLTGLFDPTTGQVRQETTTNWNEIAWKTGVLQFSKTPVKQVIADVARYYHREVQLENPSLGDCRFTGRFDHQSFDQVIRTLSLTFNTQATTQNQRTILQGGSCQ